MFENVDGRTDDRAIGILIAHLGAFGSGELKMIRKFNSIICRFFAPHDQDNAFSLLHGPIPTYY